MIKVIIKKPLEPAIVKEIESDLKTFKSIVGGYLEVFRPIYGDNSIAGYCNEEGKLIGLNPNFRWPIANDIIVGNVVIFGVSGENEVSLNDIQIKKVMDYIESNSF